MIVWDFLVFLAYLVFLCIGTVEVSRDFSNFSEFDVCLWIYMDLRNLLRFLGISETYGICEDLIWI